jgi:hypothetical protein
MPLLDLPIEEWPYLDEVVLLKTRNRKVCMTCHWFKYRCQGWTDDMVRQRGWAPEGARLQRSTNAHRSPPKRADCFRTL